MKIKSLLAAFAACVAAASPLVGSAYEYNDGTYKWGCSLNTDDEGTAFKSAYITSVQRVDGAKVSGTLAFPATVTLTLTNELGYAKYDKKSGKSNWVSTRPMQIETVTVPVDEIYFKDGVYYVDEKTKDTLEQSDPLITAVTVPEGVKWVCYVVGECLTNVTSVTLPTTLKGVWSSFGFCDKLAEVTIPETAYVDSAFIGTAWAKSMGDFFIVGDRLVRYQGQGGAVVVPDGVVTIGTAAFSPYYWEGFEEDAWKQFAPLTNITSVTLPMTVEEIGGNAFYGCENVTQVNIPKSVFEIGGYAFYGCEKLTQIELPRVISISYNAFSGSGLTSVNLPETLRDLGGEAFYHTSIASLTIPEGVKELYETCSGMTNLTSVVLPETAEYMNYTFYGCEKLATVDIPENVKSIGYGAFMGCKSLASVTGCEGLTSASYEAFGDPDMSVMGVPYVDNAADGFIVLGPVACFYKGKATETLTVPAGVRFVSAWATDAAKNYLATKTITIPDGVEVIGPDGFYCFYNVDTLNLGNTVTNLGYHCFYNCSSLTNVTGGAALQRGRDAFEETKYLDNILDAEENDEAFAWAKIGGVVLGYRGKFPAGELVIADDITEFRNGYCGDSATNVTSIVGGAGLCGYLYLGNIPNVKRIDLTGSISSIYVEEAGSLEELSLKNAELGYLDCLYDATNLVKVAVGVGEEEFGISSAFGRYSDKLASLELIRKGYRVTGFRGNTGDKNEEFPNDISTFKYIGYRDDWDSEEPGWSTFYLEPIWQAVMVDEQSLTPFDASIKSYYAGMLYDTDGKFAGTFEVTIKKASKNKDASATVKIVPLGGTKESIRGTVDAAGNGLEALAGLKFGANGAFGTLTSVKNVETFDLVGTSDATKASAGSEDAEFLKLFKDTTWGFAGTPDLLNEKASDFANGFAAFSVTIGSKGKAKIAGVMPNGTKVTVTSKMIVGDKKFAIPVAFSKSDEAFGFVIWVDFEGKIIELADATEWTGKDGARQSFVQKWGGESHFGDPLAETVEPIVRVSAADLPTGLADALTEFLPIYEEFTSADGKWTFKKTPKIKFTKGVFDQEAYDKDIAKGKTNNSGVKLTLTKKNGTFKGTFQVYTLTDKGSVKKNKATVNGIMVNGIGYGSAVIKKFGAMPVLIGHDKLAVEEE